MRIKKLVKIITLLTPIIIVSAANAAGIDPSLTTPAEQSRQRLFEAQEQLRQQEIIKSLREQQEIKPDVRDETSRLKGSPVIASDVIPKDEVPCFIITQIELVGDGAQKFQFALDDVLVSGHELHPKSEITPILGSCLGVIGINAIVARVQNAIIANGYITTRVLVAPQDLKTGMLQLTVISGRVNAIRLTPDSSKRVSIWNAVPLSSGDILNLRDIEQALENLKRVPTADANIQIEPSKIDHPGESDVVIRYQQRSPNPEKVIAEQQEFAKKVGVILQTIKQYENEPAKKAEYLTRADVQNTLHAFGDAFAHVEKDGTHYSSGIGHATDGTKPDNPNTHPDAYKNYVNTLFSVATQTTNTSRVSNSAINTLIDKVVTATSESGQITALGNTIGSVPSSISSDLVNSPIIDCGFAGDCFSKKVGDQANPQINSTYGVK